jgi:FkbM family methyltransferase
MTQDERLGSLIEIYTKHFGPTAKIIFDCGTRDGEDAAYIQSKLQAKQVYAIDANPLAIEKTRRLHPELTVIETALSDYSGEATFTQIIADREDYEGSSSFITMSFSEATYQNITVKVKTMYELLTELGLQDSIIDIVKVDLEGFTYEFLMGMGESVQNTKVFHLETETFTRHEGHRDSLAVKKFMTDAGFELKEVSYEWGPSIEDQIWINSAIE